MVSPGYPTWPLHFSLAGLASFCIGPQYCLWASSDGNSASWIQSHTIFLAEADDIYLFQFWVTRRSRAVCANGLESSTAPGLPVFIHSLSSLIFPPSPLLLSIPHHHKVHWGEGWRAVSAGGHVQVKASQFRVMSFSNSHFY